MERKSVLLLAWCVICMLPSLTEAQGWSATCSPQTCQLPECFCAGTAGPSIVPLEDTPQMLMLTFDDAVLKEHSKYFQRLFTEDRLNPNGCPILATFFVCHNWTDYELVKTLYEQGHEIASHTKTHRMPQSYWTYASYGDWEQEMEGQRDNLHKLAGIPKEDIRGGRVPYLETGGDAQFQMMTDTGYVYDSSFMTGPFTEGGVWPFTLHYPPSTIHCSNINCPKKRYPQLWEIPLNRWVGPNGRSCPMMDACDRQPRDKEDAKAFLLKNFNRHYRGNRAPLGLHLHAPWFSEGGEYKLEALEEVLDEVLRKGDVYLLTMRQVLAWMASPQSSKQAPHFEPWLATCGESARRKPGETETSIKNSASEARRNDVGLYKPSRRMRKPQSAQSTTHHGQRAALPGTTPRSVHLAAVTRPAPSKPSGSLSRGTSQAPRSRPRLPYYTRPKAAFTPSPFAQSLFPWPRGQHAVNNGRPQQDTRQPETIKPYSSSIPRETRKYPSGAGRRSQGGQAHGLESKQEPAVEFKIETKLVNDKNDVLDTEVDIEASQLDSQGFKVNLEEIKGAEKPDEKAVSPLWQKKGVSDNIQNRRASLASQAVGPATKTPSSDCSVIQHSLLLLAAASFLSSGKI